MPAHTIETIRSTIRSATLYEAPCRWKDFTVTPDGEDLIVTFEAWEVAQAGVGWRLHPNTERIVRMVCKAAAYSGWEVCNTEPDIEYPRHGAPFGMGTLRLTQRDYADEVWS